MSVFEVQPGGWLLLSILLFFGDSTGLLVILGNALIHELGHLCAIKILGARVNKITLGTAGFCISYNDFLFQGVAGAAIAFAGPLFGLVTCILMSAFGHLFEQSWMFTCAGVGFILSVFNLLPARPLDGWVIINHIFPTAAQIISVCTSLLVLCIGVVLMWYGYGIGLAVMGILLLMQEYPQTYIRHRLSPENL